MLHTSQCLHLPAVGKCRFDMKAGQQLGLANGLNPDPLATRGMQCRFVLFACNPKVPQCFPGLFVAGMAARHPGCTPAALPAGGGNGCFSISPLTFLDIRNCLAGLEESGQKYSLRG